LPLESHPTKAALSHVARDLDLAGEAASHVGRMSFGCGRCVRRIVCLTDAGPHCRCRPPCGVSVVADRSTSSRPCFIASVRWRTRSPERRTCGGGVFGEAVHSARQGKPFLVALFLSLVVVVSCGLAISSLAGNHFTTKSFSHRPFRTSTIKWRDSYEEGSRTLLRGIKSQGVQTDFNKSPLVFVRRLPGCPG
jgi:hypothetical protein